MAIKRKFREISVVTIKVGPTEVPFIVHKKPLCEASPFFQAAFSVKSGFRESNEMVTKLPEEDVEIFEMFVQWLYNPTLDFPMTNYEEEYLVGHMSLFLLAEKLDVPKLRKSLRQFFYEVGHADVDRPVSLRAVELAYTNSAEDAPIRKFVIDWLVWANDVPFRKPDDKAWLLAHPQIAVDVAVASLKLVNRDNHPLSTDEEEEYLKGIGAI